MRKIFTLSCLAFLVCVTAYAEKDCGESCFSTEIISVVPDESGCKEYTFEISWSGNCTAALSHYTVEVPCGYVSEVSNSENWKQELNSTDPTSGLYGFKIDDIKDFGEEGSPGTFIVSFKVCPDDESCDLDQWNPVVAYKAATCVYFDTLQNISKTPLEANLIITDASCSDGSDGSITTNIISGDEPFTFLWSTGDTTNILSGLSGGTYSVVIQDAHGDTLNLITEVKAPDPLNITYNVSHTSCTGNTDGTISVSASGGSAPYKYLWSNGSTETSLTALAAGNYDLTITDSLGCTFNKSFTIEASSQIAISGVVNPAGCSINNGSIDLTVSGGSGEYSIEWLDGVTSEDRENLAKGFYTVTVTDASGCESSRTFSVKENNPLNISGTITPTGCPDDNTGAIAITVSGNLGEVTYIWDNGETGASISGLSKGRYEVMVTDEEGCSLSKGFYVYGETIEIESEVVNPTCAESNDGSITLTAADDVTISWSTGDSGASLTGLSEGLYTATASNAVGCEVTYSFFIDAPDPGAEGCNDETTEDDSNTDDESTDGNDTGDEGEEDDATDNPDENSDGSTDGEDDGTTDEDNQSDGEEGDDENPDNTNGETDGGTDNPEDGDESNGDEDSENPDGEDDIDEGSNDDEEGGDGDETDTDGPEEDEDITSKTCSDPFDISIEKITDGECTYYEATVSYNGDKSYGLSHASIAVSCGNINPVYTETGTFETGLDPTTGIDGIKVDEISGFGEGSGTESFTFGFDYCTSGCENGASVEIVAAYKYGQCVSYDTLVLNAEISSLSSVAYPNPASGSVNFSLSENTFKSGNAKVEIYNPYGTMVKVMEVSNSSTFKLNVSDLPDDIYTYRIITDMAVETGKLMISNRN